MAKKIKMINKKGQIAMWVVLAIMLAASIILFAFVNKQKPPKGGDVSMESPESYIQECVREEAVKDADLMIKQGGFLEPKNYKEYKKVKIEFLCDQTSNYKSCIQQHPALFNEIESQLHDKLNTRIEECFQLFKNENEKRAAKVELGSQSLKVSLGTGKIYVNIEREVSITKEESKKTYDKFNFAINHPVYDLSRVAMEIASQEAVYCHFDPLGYSVYENQFSIRKQLFSDYSTIYTIKDKKSEKSMSIAIRSCAIPPGTILPEG